MFCRVVLFFALFPLASTSHAEPALVRVGGVVQVRQGRAYAWESVSAGELPGALRAGARVRTGAGASAEILFDDGSRVLLGADTRFVLEEGGPRRSAMRLDLGMFSAKVLPLYSRSFEVRTPAAVCRVRGTEFHVRVLAGGRTSVELVQGLLGVADNAGNQTLLRPGESLRLDMRGMGEPQKLAPPRERLRSQVRAALRRELGFDEAKAAARERSAREAKLSEFQLGRVLVDPSGHRVRVEEFVTRPSPERFKRVTLNRRQGRSDYAYFSGTFDRALPRELGEVWRSLSGTAGAAPAFVLSSYEYWLSNRTDSVRIAAQGGHAVDINSNADGSDDALSLLDPATGRVTDTSGSSVFVTLFDRGGLYLNGKLKRGWTGAGLQTYADAVDSSDRDPLTGALLTAADAWLDPGTGLLAVRSVSATFPDAGRVHERVYESYADGTALSWDARALDADGALAASPPFPGERSGAGYHAGLWGWNHGRTVSASEFGGRTIDLLAGPRSQTLIRSAIRAVEAP